MRSSPFRHLLRQGVGNKDKPEKHHFLRMALPFFVRISGRYSAGAGMIGDRIDETLRRRFRMQGNFSEDVARSIL
ncbi:hypothetical protein [Rhizobium leguminosarum]|uniref:Uncharacterized protein n=1 Tax=Rhizobium leguminosarum TaxID=384 RepID=A0A6P0B9S6_RHILE|nr:hypothetical protein [Rhizobium leguminosarum]MBY5436178.1 hypothetical protein [Rhizobium leguminosarum]NEI35876.1 hypothetical protein [Rhizobium leguminosarum]NEI42259.1 hypothetical protein [Rhizobium leguminosarum]